MGMRQARLLPPTEKVWEHIEHDEQALKRAIGCMGSSQIATAHKVFSNDRKIALSCSVKWFGHTNRTRSRREAKPFFSWQTQWSMSAAPTSSGGVAFFSVAYEKATRDRPRRYVARRNGAGALAMLMGAPEAAREAFFAEFERRFGRRLIVDTHPMLSHFLPPSETTVECQDGWHPQDLAIPGLPNIGFLSATQAATMPDFVAAIFGRRHVRKDMVKAVALASPHVIMFAADFRGLVTTDHIVTFLRDNADLDPMTIRLLSSLPASLRVQLRTLDPRSLVRLLRQGRLTQTDLREIRDLQRIEDYNGSYVRSWHEMHELTSLMASRQERTQAISPTPLSKRLDGAEFEGLRIACPQSFGDLHDWSSQMSNCIGGYTRQAARGLTVLGGIYDGEKLVANFQVDPARRELQQLLGKHNRRLPADIVDRCERYFATHKINTRDYWGKPQDTLEIRTA